MAVQKTVLTGVKPTGQIHVGNYLGAMRPAIGMCNREDVLGLLFIADYHSVTTVQDPVKLNEMIYDLTATWLALGLDPVKTMIYRQSDVPETFELAWILSCLTPKGLMNRAHAYKAIVQDNQEKGRSDLDDGVNMGLFNYPVLMAADILLFSADEVPVGEDQTQHLEIARDIAEKFNRVYGDVLKLPKVVVQKEVKTVPGLDGRKMSKSYDNTIPLFEDPKKVRKLMMKIVTDSSAPEEPKDPDSSILFDLYKEFATSAQIEELREKYKKGIGWGYVKQDLFDAFEAKIAEPRAKYQELMANRQELDRILKNGSDRARERAVQLMDRVRLAIGIRRNA
jgi:tryptophanyl-tRNA synthetase